LPYVGPTVTRTPYAIISYKYTDPRPLHSFPTRRSSDLEARHQERLVERRDRRHVNPLPVEARALARFGFEELTPERARARASTRSEEHTSELQSRGHLVCRLLPGKKKESIE